MTDTSSHMTEEQRRLDDEKIHAEIMKLIAETGKINAEARWYPLVIATGLVASVATVTGIVLHLVH
ncbi:MAG: hypothetical protein KGI52_17480 [Burkholderiales bacterium]|nr:hypothetical protein [Burkholderiales bacterium]MDE3120168.1 hypothetical protein [Paracoccaceae bacterium]